MREVTPYFLALDKQLPWSEKIKGPFDIPQVVRPSLSLLASLKVYKRLVTDKTKLQLLQFIDAKVLYIKNLKLQPRVARLAVERSVYTMSLENLQELSISPTGSISLTFYFFQVESCFRKHHIQCPNN